MKVKFSKKNVLKSCLILSLFFLLFLLVFVVVPGYVAFKTNRYVPLYSEIVEKAEQVLWKKYEDKVINVAIDEIEKEIDSLSQDEEGKVDLNKLFEKYDSVEQFTNNQADNLPSEVTADFVVAGQVYVPNNDTGKDEKYNYEFKINGSSEIDNKTEDFEGTYTVDGSAYMFSMKEKFNIKNDSENGVTFVKISDGTLLRDLGGWFYFNWEELLEEFDMDIEVEDEDDNQDEQTEEMKVSKEQADEIKGFINSDFWRPSTLGKVRHLMVSSQMYNRSWDREK